MKKLIFFGFFALTLLACSGNSSSQGEDRSSPEYSSKYICPMHCEGSGSATAGICPVCEMDYVANENYKAAN